MDEERSRRYRERAIYSLPSLIGKKISRKKENESLEILFKYGINIRNPRELLGSWYVFVLTGVLPSFKCLTHHKVFHLPGKQVHGYNVFILPITGKFEWGRNLITTSSDHLLINYDTDENGPIYRKIRDQIKFIPELGIFLGRFCYLGKEDLERFPTFVGYFSLAPTFIFNRGSKLAELCGQYSDDGFIKHYVLEE